MTDPPPTKRTRRSINYDEDASNDEFETSIREHCPKAAAESDEASSSSTNHDHGNSNGNNTDDESDPDNLDDADNVNDDEDSPPDISEDEDDDDDAAADEDDDEVPTPQDWEDHMPPPPLPREKRDEYLRLYLQVLRHYGLMYIYRCTVGQLASLAVRFIRSEEATGFRDPEVQQLIQEHRVQFGDDSFHDHERNELCCIMDYVIKQKCCIHSTIEALEMGDPRLRVLVGAGNPDFNGQRVPDLYVLIPETLLLEICQGMAFRLFDDYRRFGGHSKQFPASRYLVGLYSARVIDLDARQADETGVILAPRQDDEERVHYGEHGLLHSIVRPLGATYAQGYYTVSLFDALANNGDAHNIRLHRLVLILASQLGLTVFTDGNLEAIGLTLPEGSTYDRHINAYRPLNLRSNHERTSILRSLKYGNEHSLQCDGDHCLSSDQAYMYIHGLSCMTPVAHRINTCNIHVRRNAGHWCAGFLLSRYIDGNTFSEVDTAFIDRITWEGGEALFDRAPIEETDVFSLLPRLDNWIVDVDDDDE